MKNLDYYKLIMNSPVARALTIVGDRWTGLVLRDVFLGVRRFEEFRRRSGAARGTLTTRLKKMVENGILERVPYQESPFRYEYRLTDMGRDLYPYMLAIWDWETRWTGEKHIPPTLLHTRCDHEMRPVFRCTDCHSAIRIKEVSFTPRENAVVGEPIAPRTQRRSRTEKSSEDGVDRSFFHILDILGDRWTGLVIATRYFGLKRFDEIGGALGVATNILADRLKLLVSIGVFERIPYQDSPPRFEYVLTEKGAQIYNSSLQLHQWACKWLVEEEDQVLTLTHNTCGSRLVTELVCSECREPLELKEVTYDRNFDNG